MTEPNRNGRYVTLNWAWFKKQTAEAACTFFLPITYSWMLARHGPRRANQFLKDLLR